jgi:GAF domain-containing protein
MSDDAKFEAHLDALHAARNAPAFLPSLPGAEEGLLMATELGRRIFGAAACSVALLDEAEEHLVFRAASGEGADRVIGMRLPVGRGIAGWVVASGQPIAVADVRRDPRFAQDVAQSTGYLPQSILAAPLETRYDTLGVMEVLDRTPVPDRNDLELLVLLAGQIALRLETARSFDDVTRVLGAPPHEREGPLGVNASGALTEMAGMLAELSRLGAAEQHAAAQLIRAFLAYLRRHGELSGLE